jgi:hypothetical protein
LIILPKVHLTRGCAPAPSWLTIRDSPVDGAYPVAVHLRVERAIEMPPLRKIIATRLTVAFDLRANMQIDGVVESVEFVN